MSDLGKVIQALREDRGWTQGQLAAYAGLSASYLSQIESGQREAVAAEILARIARRLGLSSEQLLEQAGLLAPMGPEERAADALVERAMALVRSDETARDLVRLLSELPPGHRRMLLVLAMFAREREADAARLMTGGA